MKLAWLEECRRFCTAYGLLPTGHIANDAEAYLAAVESKKLSGDLEAILSASDVAVVETQSPAILRQSAPTFALQDHTGASRQASEWIGKKPTVVVFYYGYGCSHCVAQLFSLNKDLALFHELGAEIIALSADEPEHTRQQYKEYGAFDFPVLSDPGNQVAGQYGVYEPKTKDHPESLDHGTFVVDSRGQVVWAYAGSVPFLDNQSLLHVIARAEGITPSSSPKSNEVRSAAVTASTIPQ